MARSTVVTVTSDLSGEELTDATPQFVILPVVLPADEENGLSERVAYVKYSFDASDSEVIEFVKDLYADSADVLLDNVNIDSVEVGKKRNVTAGSRSDEDLSAIREWANNNGYTVAERGRIKGEVKDAYYAAHKTDDSE